MQVVGLALFTRVMASGIQLSMLVPLARASFPLALVFTGIFIYKKRAYILKIATLLAACLFFTEDLKAVDIPVLVLHGEDDQIAPYQNAALKSIKLLKNGKLITYPGFSHGMPTTEATTINKDLLEFIQA